MAVPTQLSDLNVTAASNSPAATDTLSTTDDYIRALSSILARISAGTDKLATPGTTGAMDVAGNFSVATSRFTVAAASGNTVVAGTLAVTGVVTLSVINHATSIDLKIASTAHLTVSGTGVALPTAPGFVAGDKYLVVDVNGNVHKSALGPAS